MKIKKIRMATAADKKPISSGCGEGNGNGLDKPPC
jgi:hypothetical protein